MDELIRDAQNGNTDAFEKLIGEHEKRIYNIALRMTGSRDDALDMAQEAMLKMYQNIRSFQGNSAFSTWVYRITVNVCLDELRKRKRKSALSLENVFEISDTDFSVEDLAEKSQKDKIVQEAIMKLEPNFRTVILLRDIQGFSYEETAQILKANMGTIKSRICRARKQLAQLLEPNRELFL